MYKIFFLIIIVSVFLGCNTNSKYDNVEFNIKNAVIEVEAISPTALGNYPVYIYNIMKIEGNIINNNSKNIIIQNIFLLKIYLSNIEYEYAEDFFIDENLEINSREIKCIESMTSFGEEFEAEIGNWEISNGFKECQKIALNATEAEIKITYLIEGNSYSKNFNILLNQEK